MMNLTVGYTAMQSMAKWARANGMIFDLHRAGHATSTRQKNHGVSFRVIAKWVRLAGVDHVHAGTVVGKLEGDPNLVMGYCQTLTDDIIPADPKRGLYFDQDWMSLPGTFPLASGRHPRRADAPAPLTRRGLDPAVRWRHHRPPPWGSPPAPLPTG